jgi:hypothetical protein
MAAAFIIVGTLLVTAGAALIYIPAGLIAAGLILLALGYDLTRDVVPEKGGTP